MSLRDFGWDVATKQVKDHYAVNKFGSAPSGVQTTYTDIWDRADATPTQQTHTVPTVPRVHNIASTSTNDTNTAGSGARMVKIWGVTSWETTPDSPETSETVELDGASNVATTNAYVFIHRIKVIEAGTGFGGLNEGTITATAVTDGTVSAAVQPLQGSTQMALLAIPKGWQFWMTNLNVATSKSSGSAATVNFEVVEDNYDGSTDAATVKKASALRDEISTQSTGTSTVIVPYKFPIRFTGPCVVRIRGIASGADIDGIATFQGVTTKQFY